MKITFSESKYGENLFRESIKGREVYVISVDYDGPTFLYEEVEAGAFVFERKADAEMEFKRITAGVISLFAGEGEPLDIDSNTPNYFLARSYNGTFVTAFVSEAKIN